MPKIINKTGKYFLWILASLTFVALTACQSITKRAASDELLRSLNTLHSAAKYTLQDAVARRSENTRTYFSKYHVPGMDLGAAAFNKKERGQVVISILGDRRPYNVYVLYRIEKLNGSKYKLDRYDKALAEKYLEKFNNYLLSRPKGRDVIDEFRPY
ncbi:MAG: hypothetical protein AAF203_03165 [Pseudomonadota bacterium]